MHAFCWSYRSATFASQHGGFVSREWKAQRAYCEILARQYFAGFYFRDVNRQIWKKGITFRDLSVLNFFFFFLKGLNL